VEQVEQEASPRSDDLGCLRARRRQRREVDDVSR